MLCSAGAEGGAESGAQCSSGGQGSGEQ